MPFNPQACEECGKAMLRGPIGESDFVPLVCVICYAYNNPRYALGRDAALDAEIETTKQLQQAEACARGDLLPYDPTVGGRGCAGCKRIFGKGFNQHVTAARRRFAKLERKKAAVRERIPSCAASMGCLCAFHARGGSATAPCDASE